MKEGHVLNTREFGAPWGRALAGVSTGVVVLFLALGVLGISGSAGFWTALMPILLLLAIPFMVRGYALVDGMLLIRRPGWDTRIPLDGLQSVEALPNAMGRSIRLCGNGGLFSITGLYRNKRLGNYRAFVNDLSRTVVLRFADRTIVVSPDDPQGFVEELTR